LQEQHNDARELLRVQISDELDKYFDSTEMRKARRREAGELLAGPPGGDLREDRVVEFFEKVGMYLQQNRIDEDTVYQTFSYEILRYWLAHDLYVKRVRAESHDETIYDRFEALYLRMLSHDAQERHLSLDQARPSQQTVRDFLGDEKDLSLCWHPPCAGCVVATSSRPPDAERGTAAQYHARRAQVGAGSGGCTIESS
jgi:hypothetical protein